MKRSALLLCFLLSVLLTACGSAVHYGYGPFDTVDHEDGALAAEVSEGKRMMQTDEAVMRGRHDEYL